MIIDHLGQSKQYNGLHSVFSEAFDFLKSGSWRNLEQGKYELDGERLIAIVATSESKGKEAAFLEAHRRYIDIQYVVNGVDVMGWESIDLCKHPKGDYDDEEDIIFFSDVPSNYFDVPSGYFAIFFPQDAHAPLAGVDKVKKIIIKVEV